MIVHGGNARSQTMEAMALARKYDFESADKCIETVDHELKMAHRIQTRLIQDETRGIGEDVSLLMVHAQDHLMNAMSMRDMCVEIVTLYRKFSEGGM